MVPRRYIEEWKEFAPWSEDAQVEQDLVIEHALIKLFSNPYIQNQMAFRGGTAIHKIFLAPQVRYSEEVDLVQINPGPIKDIISAIREQLGFLGKPVVKQKANNNTLVYRFNSEIPPIVNLRLKIEINCREHFTVLGYKKISHRIENTWIQGNCEFNTFAPEELLGTKLRALYQRKKGRDLFDLYYALINLDLDNKKLIQCYRQYMTFSDGIPPSGKQFIQNMEEKLQDPDFEGDIYGLLRPGIKYDQKKAFELIRSELLEKI